MSSVVLPGPVAELTRRALAGDRRAVARLLTLLDDGGEPARAIAAALAAHAGRARVVGVTGVPGSGKSSLVNALLGAWLERGLKVAVIAIDPSSPLTGGAVLGDRVRMGEHGTHPDVFIRSLSARGALGGLSRSTRAAVDCLDAAGFDHVVVETVGAGQSETAVAGLVDTCIVVCAPGLGDEVQAIKAGTLEIGDILAVSKGDLPAAAQTAREMKEMLGLRRGARVEAERGETSVWATPVVTVAAQRDGGIDELLAALDAHSHRVAPGRRLRLQPPAGVGMFAPQASGAETVARLATLAARDGLGATLGISFLDGGPGQASVAMTVGPQHLNFNGACHGGALFALADSAFGLASNSHGPLAAGIDAHITYQASVGAGDRLVARAVEVHRGRRLAVYRIDVVRDETAPTPVSSFTGTVYLKD